MIASMCASTASRTARSGAPGIASAKSAGAASVIGLEKTRLHGTRAFGARPNISGSARAHSTSGPYSVPSNAAYSSSTSSSGFMGDGSLFVKGASARLGIARAWRRFPKRCAQALGQ